MDEQHPSQERMRGLSDVGVLVCATELPTALPRSSAFVGEGEPQAPLNSVEGGKINKSFELGKKNKAKKSCGR